MSPRRLVVHFDVNGTVIMQDTVKGETLEFTLSHVIATQAWGTVQEKESGNVWRLAYDSITLNRPNPDFKSYKEFARLCYPEKTPEEEPDENRREAINTENEVSYKQMLIDFTKYGKPGYKFKNLFDKMTRCLSIPKLICEEFGFSEEAKNEDGPEEVKTGSEPLQKLFKDGKVFLLPSFFRFVMGLRKAKREFAVVFRSFGTDLHDVVYEFNRFCEGSHPCYNGKNGCPLVRFDRSKGSKDMRIDETNTGYVTRLTKSMSDVTFVRGTFHRHPEGESPEVFHSGPIDEGSVRVYREAHNIYVAFHEILQHTASIAISDDWKFWSANDFSDDSGKLLLVDQTDYGTQHIFFDDNVREDASNIIDVRDVVTGDSLPFKRIANKYIFRVDPYKAIIETDYFLKALDICEQNRTVEIERVEAGLPPEPEESEPEPTEWELLHSAPTEEYLGKVILPLLLPALKVVDLERPQDPLSFIAHYCLKNKGQIVLPPQPVPEEPVPT
mmetsp:Transcript_27129/g.48682  ORF Transcript_27129/g.48682 Transcript_27129/m.48682 type:complete len:499 (-) Transcript_27129:35-1531(-)